MFFGSAMDTRVKPAYDIVIKSRHIQFTAAYDGDSSKRYRQ
jgi:hypothetical protein